MKHLSKGSLLALAATLAMSASAQAAITIVPQSALVASTGYYTNNLGSNIVTTGGGNAANVGQANGRNDDGFQGPVALGFNYTLFGTTYDSLYINNNGNVSFGDGISAFVPTGPTGANAPVISPWFGDVDTRGARSGVVRYQLDTPGQLVVTWDNVGYYDRRDNLLNSFQLVLRSDNYVIPNGEGQIGFFYKTMDWIRTDTSTTAAIGFGDGDGNGQVIFGSATQANLNDIAENHHIWFDANLVVVPPIPGVVPEPTTWALMIMGFGAVGGALRRRKLAFA